MRRSPFAQLSEKTPNPCYNLRVMELSSRWCVIAESSKAQIYAVDAEYHFQRVEMLTVDEYELGAGPATQGRCMHHEFDRKNPKSERGAKELAKRIGAFLERAQREGRVSSLILAADPALLGFVRAALRPAVKQLVEAEIPKRYRGSVAELEKLIFSKVGSH